MVKNNRKELHSIIVPVYESSAILKTLVERILNILSEKGINFELVLIDDGSNDGSFEEIKRLASQYDFIRGYRLSRNFGHQAALHIGLEKCKGKYIAIIDDDLQDPPEILPAFFNKLYDSADVVYGIRKNRKESFLKKFLFKRFYRILNTFSSVKIPLDAGDFCAMRRGVVEAMLQMPLARLFLRGTRAWAGFRQIGVEYERAERFDGKSGYTVRKYLEFAIVGLLIFSYIPLRLATFIGVLVTTITGVYVIVTIIRWILAPFEVPGYLSLIAIITFLGGTQLICLGIIGEYLTQINDNVRKWPVAFVSESIDGAME